MAHFLSNFLPEKILGYLKEFLRKKLKSAKKVTKLHALTVISKKILLVAILKVTDENSRIRSRIRIHIKMFGSATLVCSPVAESERAFSLDSVVVGPVCEGSYQWLRCASDQTVQVRGKGLCSKRVLVFFGSKRSESALYLDSGSLLFQPKLFRTKAQFFALIKLWRQAFTIEITYHT